MRNKKRSNFGDKVSWNAQKERKGINYLNLPEGIKVYNPKENVKEIYLDFLPYKVTDPKHPDHNEERQIALVGDLWYKRPFRTHRIGEDNEMVVCPKSIGKPCPICEYITKRLDEGADWNDVKAMKYSDRNLYIVVPLDDKDHDAVPHIFDISYFCFQKILKEELELRPENGIFPSLEDGKTSTVKLIWEQFGERGKPFPKARDITFEDRDSYEESILDEIPNLDNILIVLSYERLRAKFFDMEDEEAKEEIIEDDDTVDVTTLDHDEDTIPQRRQRTKREPEPEEELDEEEQPKQRTRTRQTRQEKKEETKGNGKCKYGHEFGKDFDVYRDCADCEIYNECDDENMKIAK